MNPRHLQVFSPPSPSPPSQPLPESPTNNLNPSLLIIGLILVGVFVVSASVHLLLRYINHRCNSSNDTDNEDDDDDDVIQIQPPIRISSRRRVAPEGEDHKTLIESLPLFTFKSLSNLRSSSADCAVCLSKFESEDQLRLLPLCCHAFHAQCIDTWLSSNQTCPLCRSSINVTDSDILSKLFPSSSGRSDSFRVEIGNVSRRRMSSDSGRLRSYSMGSFDYLVENESEVVVEVEQEAEPETQTELTHRRGESEGTKEEVPSSAAVGPPSQPPQPPGSDVAADVCSGRGWLKEYVDRLSSSSSLSSRFRFSGRLFAGSSRRTDSSVAGVVTTGGSWDLEGNQYSEEISGFFRWLAGV